MKLYIGNLSFSTTEDTLREAFSNYGEVVSVQIIKDKFTEQSKGFGFVEMASDIMGERGIGGMNGKTVDGRRIRVSEAVEKPKFSNGAKKFLKKGIDNKNYGERNSFNNRNEKRSQVEEY
ncbi:RNA recognition motif domain-containing protein [Treponema sp.]|uniref:RNA recognition motif domain-containing protein n=1 Tax=Treponema sp. TaxID=166 RepID=UPI00388DD412